MTVSMAGGRPSAAARCFSEHSKRRRTWLLSSAAALAASLAVGAPAVAQDADDDGLAIEEIVVTAERRAKNLQEVPISITAFTGDELNKSAIESTIDLQYRTPGMVFTTNSVLGQPYIRGIGSDVISSAADASVAAHIDGVYQARAVAALQDFFDLERIEVLRGPQGTLYGRNATGGAINYISNKPQPELAMKANLIYGNYDKIRFGGMINSPIVEDKVLLRLSGMRTARDGFRKNLLNMPSAASGFDNTSQDGEGFWSLRGHLQFNVGDNLTFLVSGDYLEERSSRSLGPSPNEDLPSPARDFFGGMTTGSVDSVLFDVPSFAEVDAWGLSATLTWELESVTVTSLTAYRETHFFEELDIDGTSADYLFNKPLEDSEVFTEEITVASAGEGNLEWVVGGFYLHEEAGQYFDVGGGLFDNIVFFPGFALNPAGVVEVDAWALFGQGTYHINEKLSLTAGLRYSSEKKDHAFLNAIISNAFAVRAGGLAGCDALGIPLCDSVLDDDKWTAWTPKFGVEYLASDDVMAYATVSRGFKSGGFNSADGDKFDPEFLWSYEVGLKATWMDGRLRTNLSAFYYDYTDIQVQKAVPGFGGGLITLENAASAEIWGAELEVTARPAVGWELTAGLALLNAEYTDYCTIDPDAPLVFDAVCGVDAAGNSNGQDLSGGVLPRAPKLGLTASAEYQWDVGDHGSMFLRGEWRYQSEIFFDQFENQGVNQKRYHMLNARLQYDSAGGNWYAALWAKNIADKIFKQSVIRNTGLIGSLDFFGPRRTYGAQIGYTF